MSEDKAERLIAEHLRLGYLEAVEGAAEPGETVYRITPEGMEWGRKQVLAAMKRERLVQALLLFHSAEAWDEDRRRRWEELTGHREATTKVLCDLAREIAP